MSTVHGTAVGTESQQADVIHRKVLGSRTFILNRPKRLNALDLSMIRNMTPQLQAWETSDLAKVVVLKGEGEKGFCAGGDVKTVVDLAKAKDPAALKFFEEEYQLNHMIASLKTPFVAIMDGITMGGGVGLSVHAPFRIATENTVFAMPETAIGLFPDVGGSFFLPRMDGEIGTYLALTGERLKGKDVFFSGIATHYVPTSRLQAMEDRLAELDSSDHDVINAAIEDFVGTPEEDATKYSLAGDVRAAIDRCFKFDSVDKIMDALKKEDSDWARKTITTLEKMSPTSLKVTLQQLRLGKKLSIADCFRLEFKLVQKFLVTPDFHEGVMATLVRKSKERPNWKPSTIAETSDADIKAAYFDAPSPQQLSLLNKVDFHTYPHGKYGLPTEFDIQQVITGEAPDVGNYAMNKDEVVNWFLRERNGKVGVREKVEDTIARKTKIVGEGEGSGLKWVR